MSRIVLKQETSEQKSQMAAYEQLEESVELGPYATLVKDIYYILDMEKQPVFKISNKIQTDTIQNDPSNSKKGKKSIKKEKTKTSSNKL